MALSSVQVLNTLQSAQQTDSEVQDAHALFKKLLLTDSLQSDCEASKVRSFYSKSGVEMC